MKTNIRGGTEAGADLSLSDSEIIALYQERNESAIRETDRKYGNYLFTIAFNMLHDRLDCEECLNDTYLGVWNRIPPQVPQVFHAFIAKIMRNIAINRYKQKNAQKRIPCELTVSLEELRGCTDAIASSESQEVASRELGRILNAYIKTLDKRQTFVFVCRYYYADRIADIAAMLGVSENTVFRDLSRIREGLREELKKEGYSL